jgi:hypothetical protein
MKLAAATTPTPTYANAPANNANDAADPKRRIAVPACTHFGEHRTVCGQRIVCGRNVRGRNVLEWWVVGEAEGARDPQGWSGLLHRAYGHVGFRKMSAFFVVLGGLNATQIRATEAHPDYRTRRIVLMTR